MVDNEKMQTESNCYDYTDLEVAEYLKQASSHCSDSDHYTATGSSCSSSIGSHDTIERSKSTSVMTNVPRGNFAASRGDCSPGTDTLTLNELAFRGELTAAHLETTEESVDSRLTRKVPESEGVRPPEVGFTPLITAASCGWLHVVELLLNNGATIDATDVNGATALIHAAYMGHTLIVEALLSSGASVNSQCKDGNTALHYAVYANNQSCVTALLTAGADLTLNNNSSLSPPTLAASLNRLKVQDAFNRHLLGLFMDE